MTLSLVGQSKLWDRALAAFSFVDVEPEEEILAFLNQGPAHLGLQGLDIGCGLGRHTLTALKLGFKMAAVDFSELAVAKTRALVSSHGYYADIRLASMDSLPFNDGEFDFTFSWCVLNHGTRALFEQALLESVRVLRPGGISFGFVMSRSDPRYGHGIQIEEDCFIFIKGIESNLCHYFPSKVVLESVLQKAAHIEEIREIQFTGKEIQVYHPEFTYSSHFAFRIRKFDLHAPSVLVSR